METAFRIFWLTIILGREYIILGATSDSPSKPPSQTLTPVLSSSVFTSGNLTSTHSLSAFPLSITSVVLPLSSSFVCLIWTTGNIATSTVGSLYGAQQMTFTASHTSSSVSTETITSEISKLFLISWADSQASITISLEMSSTSLVGSKSSYSLPLDPDSTKASSLVGVTESKVASNWCLLWSTSYPTLAMNTVLNIVRSQTLSSSQVFSLTESPQFSSTTTSTKFTPSRTEVAHISTISVTQSVLLPLTFTVSDLQRSTSVSEGLQSSASSFVEQSSYSTSQEIDLHSSSAILQLSSSDDAYTGQSSIIPESSTLSAEMQMISTSKERLKPSPTTSYGYESTKTVSQNLQSSFPESTDLHITTCTRMLQQSTTFPSQTSTVTVIEETPTCPMSSGSLLPISSTSPSISADEHPTATTVIQISDSSPSGGLPSSSSGDESLMLSFIQEPETLSSQQLDISSSEGTVLSSTPPYGQQFSSRFDQGLSSSPSSPVPITTFMKVVELSSTSSYREEFSSTLGQGLVSSPSSAVFYMSTSLVEGEEVSSTLRYGEEFTSTLGNRLGSSTSPVVFGMTTSSKELVEISSPQSNGQEYNSTLGQGLSSSGSSAVFYRATTSMGEVDQSSTLLYGEEFTSTLGQSLGSFTLSGATLDVSTRSIELISSTTYGEEPTSSMEHWPSTSSLGLLVTSDSMEVVGLSPTMTNEQDPTSSLEQMLGSSWSSEGLEPRTTTNEALKSSPASTGGQHVTSSIGYNWQLTSTSTQRQAYSSSVQLGRQTSSASSSEQEVNPNPTTTTQPLYSTQHGRLISTPSHYQKTASTLSITTPTTSRKHSYDFLLRIINLVYVRALEDPQSDEYKNTTKRVVRAVLNTFENVSEIERMIVNNYLNGSVIANFTLYFKKVPLATPEDLHAILTNANGTSKLDGLVLKNIVISDNTQSEPSKEIPDDDDSLPGWAIALIVFFLLAFLIIIIVIFIVLYRRRWHRGRETQKVRHNTIYLGRGTLNKPNRKEGDGAEAEAEADTDEYTETATYELVQPPKVGEQTSNTCVNATYDNPVYCELQSISSKDHVDDAV